MQHLSEQKKTYRPYDQHSVISWSGHIYVITGQRCFLLKKAMHKHSYKNCTRVIPKISYKMASFC